MLRLLQLQESSYRILIGITTVCLDTLYNFGALRKGISIFFWAFISYLPNFINLYSKDLYSCLFLFLDLLFVCQQSHPIEILPFQI